MTAGELTVTKLQLSCGHWDRAEIESNRSSLLTLYAAWITPESWNVPTNTYKAHTEFWLWFSRLFQDKITFFLQTFRGTLFIFMCIKNIFKNFFQTFRYLWSFSRLLTDLKISTLNSRTFHTFPGSVHITHMLKQTFCSTTDSSLKVYKAIWETAEVKQSR